ncbi:MAG: hypothetical protein ACR2P0_20845 [Acidimicrobiales bacterium]
MVETELMIKRFAEEAERRCRPVTIDEVEQRVERAQVPGRNGHYLALAAAAVAVVVGMVVLIDFSGNDGEQTIITDQPETETTLSRAAASPADEPSATAPPVDTSRPAPIDPERLPGPASGETQQTIVGEITWTLLQGDETTQPEHVAFEFEGEFFGSTESEGLAWRSSNGIDWTRGEPLVDGWFNPFEFDGETWGLVYSNTGAPDLVRWNGTSFDSIDLPSSGAPRIDGLEARGSNFGELVQFGELAIAPAQTWYDVPWTDFYEGSEPPPPPNGPPDGEPMLYAEWDVVTERIRLVDVFANSEIPVAVLAPELTSGTDGRVDLRDVDSGEIVTTVVATPDLFDDALRSAVIGGGFSHTELLIGSEGDFRIEPVPWPASNVVALRTLGSQLLALVLTENRSTPGEWMPDWALWTSSDTRTWTELDLPAASGGVIDHIEMVATGDSLLLTMIVSSDFDQRPEMWTTTDAVTWTPSAVEFDGFDGPTAADFGWYRDPFHDMNGLWVSPDAVTWQVIDLDIREPRGSGSAGATVVGNTIFVSTNEDSGPRTMWVGVVDPP